MSAYIKLPFMLHKSFNFTT